MDPIVTVYVLIMKSGAVTIRNALAVGDTVWATIEAEHLHGIPSLIMNGNRARHLYYLNHSVPLYLEAIKETGRGDIAAFAKRSYFALWDRIRTLVDANGGARKEG